MDSPIGDRRTEIARAFATGKVDPPRLEHSRLRFSLGTSLADLSVPFHPSPEVPKIIGFAGRQLAMFLFSRHRDLAGPEEFDKYLLTDEYAKLPAAPATLTPASGGPEVRSAAFLGFRLHPLLTGGVCAAWLGPGGGGRSLVALAIEILRKGFTEVPAGAPEETPTLVAMMIARLLPAADFAVRELKLTRVVDRQIRAATSVGVYLALRLALERVAREQKASPEVQLRMEAVLSPAALLGGRAMMFGGGAIPYGVDLGAGPPLVDETMTMITAGAPSAQIEARFAEALAPKSEWGRRAELAVGSSALRNAFLHVALLGEQHLFDDSLTQFMRDVATIQPRLTGLLTDEKARKELIKDLGKLSGDLSASAKQAALALVNGLKAFKDSDPSACAGITRPAAIGLYVRTAIAAISDLWLDRTLAPVTKALALRDGTESEIGLEGEYTAGRMYRVGPGEPPLLRAAVTEEVGHLFVDVKDFTRRTSLLGQVAIAEFLRQEFYLPILNAAKEHFGGMSHLSDRGGVTINNLLGDALSLSGSIEALVNLALAIRRHLVSYEQQLMRSVSSDTVAAATTRIIQEFEKKRAALKEGESEAQLTSERDAALSRAKGEGLEAGVFVSFGPAPLVVTIEDEVFGRSRVAIADRINESARGTARAGSARAKADSLLQAERSRRRDPALAHPWSVFVGAPFSLTLPTLVEEAARTAVRAGDVNGAMFALTEALREALTEAARAEDRPGDIYNAGAALSEEAMAAYQKSVGTARAFRSLEVMPEALHPEVRKRFFFPPAPLKLVIGFKPNAEVAELFRYAGKVMFKGLEKSGGIHVWEIVTESSGVGAMLAKHHAVEWFKATAKK